MYLSLSHYICHEFMADETIAISDIKCKINERNRILLRKLQNLSHTVKSPNSKIFDVIKLAYPLETFRHFRIELDSLQ